MTVMGGLTQKQECEKSKKPSKDKYQHHFVGVIQVVYFYPRDPLSDEVVMFCFLIEFRNRAKYI